jgi:pyruvate carboxylase subunit B
MEAMKMELPLKAPVSGIVTVLLAKPGDMLTATQPLMNIE